MSVHTSDLRDAAFNVGWEADDARIITDYSGRGMYGDTCLAIIAPEPSVVTQIIAKYAGYEPDLASDLAAKMRLDDMGRGVVAYFPGVPFEGEGDTEEEDE